MQNANPLPFVSDSATYVRVLHASNNVYCGGEAVCKQRAALTNEAVFVQVRGYLQTYDVQAYKGEDGRLYISDTQEQYIYN